MFPFNKTVADVSPSLPRRRVADCCDHMETRLYLLQPGWTNVNSLCRCLDICIFSGRIVAIRGLQHVGKLSRKQGCFLKHVVSRWASIVSDYSLVPSLYLTVNLERQLSELLVINVMLGHGTRFSVRMDMGGSVFTSFLLKKIAYKKLG